MMSAVTIEYTIMKTPTIFQISSDLRFFLTVRVLVLFYAFGPRGPLMLSAAVVGTCFILSIGTLIAHAVDAFRDRLTWKSL